MSDLLQALADVAGQSNKGKLWYCFRTDCDGEPHEGAHWCTHPMVSKEHNSTCRHARAEQRPPEGDDWFTWLFLAGRGTGKTRSASEFITDVVKKGQAKRIALVGRTPADVRDIMIEGVSGLIQVGELRGIRPEFQPTKRRLVWPNGAQAFSYSAEVPAQLKGPEHDYAWADELAAWTDAPKGESHGVDNGTSWSNLLMGMRLDTAKPKIVVTTTPRPVLLMRQIKAKPSTVVVQASSYSNIQNLANTFVENVLAPLAGTRAERQEVFGEDIEDIEGALWSLAQIDTLRVKEAPELSQIVVSVDPSGGSKSTNDEVGIIVVGKSADGHGYVLEDASGRYAPSAWARKAISAYERWQADRIIGEVNFGGEMVENTLRAEKYQGRFKIEHASRGKTARAEPIAALYGDPSAPETWLARGRVHHVGSFPKLEDQMTTWVQGTTTKSPDRMDALVWGMHALGLRIRIGEGFIEAWKNMSRPKPTTVSRSYRNMASFDQLPKTRSTAS